MVKVRLVYDAAERSSRTSLLALRNLRCDGSRDDSDAEISIGCLVAFTLLIRPELDAVALREGYAADLCAEADVDELGAGTLASFHFVHPSLADEGVLGLSFLYVCHNR